jgi:hypothetical protein
MSTNYKIQLDLDEAKTMAEGLEDYVRGNELYGHTGGSFFSTMPSLTVGALLMRLRRLDALRDLMEDRQYKALDGAVDLWENVRKDWRVHYEGKMQHEMRSRLDSMKTFFRECDESPTNCHNNYRPELLRRTIVQEIIREMDKLGIELEAPTRKKLEMVDNKLRSLVREDEFQWTEGLEGIYSKDEFWWLYSIPPLKENK